MPARDQLQDHNQGLKTARGHLKTVTGPKASPHPTPFSQPAGRNLKVGIFHISELPAVRVG